MGAAIVGEVAIKVRPDTSGFGADAKKEIEAQLRKMRPEVRVQAKFDFKQAYAELHRLVRQLNRAARADRNLWVKLRVDFDEALALKDMDALKGLMQEESDKSPLDLTPGFNEETVRDFYTLLREEAERAQEEIARQRAESEEEARTREKRAWTLHAQRLVEISRKAWDDSVDGKLTAINRLIDFSEKPIDPYKYSIGKDLGGLYTNEAPDWAQRGQRAAEAFSKRFSKHLSRGLARITKSTANGFTRRFLLFTASGLDGLTGIFKSERVREAARDAGEKAAAGFIEGLSRLSGFRMASDFARDTWEPLQNFDRYLPRLVAFSSALTTLAGAAGAAASNVLALGRDVARIVPTLLAVPGAAVSAGLAFSALVVAFKTLPEMAPEIDRAFQGTMNDMAEGFWKSRAQISKSIVALAVPIRKGLKIVSAATGKFVGEFASSLQSIVGPSMEGMFLKTAEGMLRLKEHTDGMARVLRGLGVIGTTYFPKMMNWVGELADSFGRWLDNAIRTGKAFKWIDTAWARMKDLGSVIAEASGLLADLSRIAEKAGGASMKELAGGLRRVRDGLKEGAQGAETLGKFLRASHGIVKEFSKAIGPGLGNFLVSMGDIAEEVGPKLSAAFGGVIGAFLDGFSSPAFARATRTMANHISTIGDLVEPVARQSSELVGIFDTINAAIVPFGKLAVGMVGGILSAIDSLGPSLTKVVSALGNTASDLAMTVFRPLTEFVGALGPLLEGLAGTIASIFDHIQPGVESMMTSLVRALGSLGPLIEDMLPGLGAGLALALDGVVDLADGILRLVDAAARFAGTGLAHALGGVATGLGAILKVIGQVVKWLGQLAQLAVNAVDALGPLGDALGYVAGIGIGAGVAVTGLKKGAGVARGYAEALGLVAVASSDVEKKGKKGAKGIAAVGNESKKSAGHMKGTAKAAGALSAALILPELGNAIVNFGSGAVEGEHLANAMRQAADGTGDLNAAFRSFDGKAIGTDFFGAKVIVDDYASALKAVVGAHESFIFSDSTGKLFGFLENGWSRGYDALRAMGDELAALPLEEATRQFAVYADETERLGIEGMGVNEVLARMPAYQYAIQTALRDSGFPELADDMNVVSEVARGRLPEGLQMVEGEIVSVAEATRLAREELREERLTSAIEEAFSLAPQYAQRSMSQAVAEIQSSVDGLGQLFASSMPEIREYWTQIGGGGEQGAKLADNNLKILTDAFSSAQSKLAELGVDVSNYGGDWSKMMNEMFKSGGAQAEAAKAALNTIGDALKQTGLDYASLQEAVKEMDLDPGVEAALLELIRFQEEAPGHIKEGIGAGWVAANEQHRIALGEMAENAREAGNQMRQSMIETQLGWVDAADAMQIPIQELYDRMENPPKLFDGMDLTYDAKVQILDLMGVEGELRSRILAGALMFNGMDPTQSVSEQMKARSEEVNALRRDIETPVGEMNDPTQPVKTGIEQTREQLALMKNGDYHIPEMTDPTTMVQNGAHDASVHLQWLADQAWAVKPLADPTTEVRNGVTTTTTALNGLSGVNVIIPNVNDPTTPVRDGASKASAALSALVGTPIVLPELNDPTPKAREGVEKLKGGLRPGLPLTGVDNSKQLQSAYDGVGNKASAMATKVGAQSARMKAGFEAAANSMSSRAATAFGREIPAQSQRMASQIQSATTKSASQLTRLSTSARTTATGVSGQYRQMSTEANTMANNTGRAVGRVGSELGRIPGIARGATNGAGSWLRGAGGRIMDGLLDGIRSRIGSLRNLLGRVTSMIPSWKGPPDKDAVLLRPAGQLIMQGLAGGLWDSFQTDVKPALMRISDEIANTRIDPLNVDMSARTDLYSAHGNIAGRNDATGGNNVSVTVQYPHPDSTPRAIQRGAQTAAALL